MQAAGVSVVDKGGVVPALEKLTVFWEDSWLSNHAIGYKDRTHTSCIAGRFFTTWTTGEGQQKAVWTSTAETRAINPLLH